MIYYIDKAALYDLIDAEVSRVADAAYAGDGTSLYDSVVLTEKDRDMVDDLIDDAVSAFMVRTWDISTFYRETDTDDYGETVLTGRVGIRFLVSDFPEALEDITADEISRYIALFSAAGIFRERQASSVPKYDGMAKDAMDKAVTLLSTRVDPVRV